MEPLGNNLGVLGGWNNAATLTYPPNTIPVAIDRYNELMAMQVQVGEGTNINIRQVENGYIVSSAGKQWLAEDVEKIKELVVVIMVGNALTDAA